MEATLGVEMISFIEPGWESVPWETTDNYPSGIQDLRNNSSEEKFRKLEARAEKHRTREAKRL